MDSFFVPEANLWDAPSGPAMQIANRNIFLDNNKVPRAWMDESDTAEQSKSAIDPRHTCSALYTKVPSLN